MKAHTIPIHTLVVHHSASPLTTTVEDIKRWHVEENGWDDVGYHYVVSQAGILHACRPLHVQGAHAYGHNDGTIGVCLIGHNPHESSRWTREQVFALQELYMHFRRVIPGIGLAGHRDLTDGTECPGLDVRALLFGPRYGVN